MHQSFMKGNQPVESVITSLLHSGTKVYQTNVVSGEIAVISWLITQGVL